MNSKAETKFGWRAVTIAVDGMTFHRPVFVGDEVSVFATLTKVDHTSLGPRYRI